ncbi:MAG: Uncharacterised protein [Methanobacteriota archaeon]|nr:MAG: Uncharacterised protein [Euryarchaeota archaeon]
MADGGSSISETAKSIGLRLPHASATFKKLRSEGLVTIDQSESHRGSIQRLTPEGWAKLEQDELARLSEIKLEHIPSNAAGCLIARDGPMLLLGYLESPTNEGFLLPSKPIPSDKFDSIGSNGNIGVEVEWTWAVSREPKPRWFSLPNLQKTSSPKKTKREGITDWDQKEKSIGIIRARLLESDKQFSLSVGSWFPKAPADNNSKLPSLLNEDYSWTLATFHDYKHKIKPQQPVIAEITGRLGINLLLEAASCDGIVIGESGLLSRKTNSFPIQILLNWIKRIHPKSSEKIQKDRYEFLISELGVSNRNRKRRRSSGEQSTWTKFKLDWANSKWVKEINSNDLFFDNSQLSKNALLSIVDWAMTESKGVPLSIQYPRNIELNEIESDNLVRYPALRIIITEKWKGRKPQLLLKESNNSSLPIMDLCLERGIILPISVEISTVQNNDSVIEENVSIPFELISLIKKSKIDINDISKNNEKLLNCIKQYPLGNEFEANKLEFEYPLESWIITPSNLRWLRWQRISKRIDGHWVELLPPELVPIENIGTVALNAPQEWKIKAREIMISKLQIEPDSSLNLRKILLNGSNNEKAWWFSCLITSAQWLAPSIRKNVVKIGLKPWIELHHKLSLNDFTDVLNNLSWMEKLNEINNSWTSLIYTLEINENHVEIKLWKNLINKFQNNTTISFEDVSKISHKFNIEWWAPLAEEFLKICLETSKGRSWLESENVSWVSAILREKEEIHYLPGFGNTKHPGCSNNLLDNLNQNLDKIETSKNSIGILQLIDLQSTLTQIRNKNRPSVGKCHKHCGWLGQPIELWPEINSLIDFKGDNEVTKRIFLRKTGFHKDLEISPQTKLT